MMQPEYEAMRALVMLQQDPNWQRVQQWLRDALAHIDRQNRRSQGDLTRQLQGAGQVLEKILDCAENCGELCLKIEEAEKRKRNR